MKAMLKRMKKELYFYRESTKIIVATVENLPDGLRGDISPYLSGDISPYLRGNISGLSGDISGLRGDISGLRGDISGLSGNISPYLRGDISLCEITAEERKAGIDIATLIIEES